MVNFEIYNEVYKSTYMLKFEEGWDEENPESPTYSPKLLKYVANWLINKVYWFLDETYPVPKIYHSDNGSIDVLWDNHILVNIDSNHIASYYAETKNGKKYNGNVDLDYDREEDRLTIIIVKVLDSYK